MNSHKLRQEERKWEIEKHLKEREYKLREEKKSFKNSYKKHISTTKLLIFFLFINFTVIELFTGYITIQSIKLATSTLITPDYSPLLTLLGAVLAETLSFLIYCAKSAKENQAGGISYETAMYNLKQQQDDIEITNFNFEDNSGDVQ